MKIKLWMAVVIMFLITGCGSSVKEVGAISGADPTIVTGTYLGNSGSAITIYSDGSADYYWVGYDTVQSENEWNYDGTQLNIHISSLKCDVYATITGDAIVNVPFNSTSKNWDAENFTKVMTDANHWSSNDYKKMFDEVNGVSSAVASERIDESEGDKVSSASNESISPEFKREVDDLEAFYNSYCDFMEKYAKAAQSGDMMSMMDQYTKFVSDYVVYEQKLEKMNNNQSGMNQEEMNYFLDAYNRIMKRLASVAYSVN